MSVKLELYRVFKEVAAQRNISAAASSLYLSQSAVSQSIKQLETQLQVRLFSRSPRGVQLTREGAMLYDYVRQAMGLLEHGEQKLALSRELLLGELVIGANDTVTRTYRAVSYAHLYCGQIDAHGARILWAAGKSAWLEEMSVIEYLFIF